MCEEALKKENLVFVDIDWVGSVNQLGKVSASVQSKILCQIVCCLYPWDVIQIKEYL